MVQLVRQAHRDLWVLMGLLVPRDPGESMGRLVRQDRKGLLVPRESRDPKDLPDPPVWMVLTGPRDRQVRSIQLSNIHGPLEISLKQF